MLGPNNSMTKTLWRPSEPKWKILGIPTVDVEGEKHRSVSRGKPTDHYHQECDTSDIHLSAEEPRTDRPETKGIFSKQERRSG